MSDNNFNTWELVKLFIMEYLKQFHHGTITINKLHKAVDDITDILEKLLTE